LLLGGPFDQDSDLFFRSRWSIGGRIGQRSRAVEIGHAAAGKFASGRIEFAHGGSVIAAPAQSTGASRLGLVTMADEHGFNLCLIELTGPPMTLGGSCPDHAAAGLVLTLGA